jgi:hypothetical protein
MVDSNKNMSVAVKIQKGKTEETPIHKTRNMILHFDPTDSTHDKHYQHISISHSHNKLHKMERTRTQDHKCFTPIPTPSDILLF